MNWNLIVKVIVNTYGPGPALAIKYGIDNSVGNSICVAMGDGSDDPKQVEDLFLLIDRGLSRSGSKSIYKKWKYIGNKSLKYFLSKYSGYLLNFFLDWEQMIQQICLKLTMLIF